jgi:hypothetical protein
VAGRKGAQHAAAFGCQRKYDATVVHGVMGAPHQAFCDGSVGEFDNTVLAQTKALREKSDSGLAAFRKPGDLQQQLVLARLQTALLRGLFAEAEEAAQGIAELGECEQ